ncbi:MAG: cysteine--tRNA ligase [Acidimicrobiales bacterium]
MLRLFDTATASLRPLDAGNGPLGMYICGPTVYGPPHVGHGRFCLVYDVLRRYLEWSGTSVLHVSNITDIDDKIIKVAADSGRSWQEVAGENVAAWFEAMDAMGIARPHEIPRATDYVEQMVELVGHLLERGAAYETADAVYFSAAFVSDYGLLAHQAVDSLRAGARVEPNENKRAPVDFALWKKAKPGEPRWPSPFGYGRPGWHTECVVMSLELLGEGFALHGAGEDLKFPHNENERAQAEALGRRSARHWVHNGMLISGEEKMSKSLGNTAGLLDLVGSGDPRAYRLVVLQAHYREQMKLDEARLSEAGRALQGLDALARRLEDAKRESSAPGMGVSKEALSRFSSQMDDDLGTPSAIAGLFEAARASNSALDHRDAAAGLALGGAVLDAFSALGLVPSAHVEVSEGALHLARQRDAARAGRDFALADRLREELAGLGYRVEDTPGGTRLLR